MASPSLNASVASSAVFNSDSTSNMASISSRPSSAVSSRASPLSSRPASATAAQRRNARQQTALAQEFVTSVRRVANDEQQARRALAWDAALAQPRVELESKESRKRARITAEEARGATTLVKIRHRLVFAAAALAMRDDEDVQRAVLDDDCDRAWLELFAEEALHASAALALATARTAMEDCFSAYMAYSVAQLDIALDRAVADVDAAAAAAYDSLAEAEWRDRIDIEHAAQRVDAVAAEAAARPAIASAEAAARNALVDHEAINRACTDVSGLESSEDEARAAARNACLSERHAMFAECVDAGEARQRAEIDRDGLEAIFYTASAYRLWLASHQLEAAEDEARRGVCDTEAAEHEELLNAAATGSHSIRAAHASVLLGRVARGAFVRLRFAWYRRAMVQRRREALGALGTQLLRARQSELATCRLRVDAAATTIQRAACAAQSLRLAHDRHERLCAAAVARLQAVGRGYVGRVMAGLVQHEVRVDADETRWRETMAAMRIQWMARACFARRIAQQRRDAEAAEGRHLLRVARVQAALRTRTSGALRKARSDAAAWECLYLLQRVGRAMLLGRNALRSSSAALLIQACVRAKLGWIAAYQQAYFAPAAAIQRMVRCVLARRRHEQAAARRAAYRSFRLKHNAAAVMARVFWGHKGRKIARAAREALEQKRSAARDAAVAAAVVRLQPLGRGCAVRAEMATAHVARRAAARAVQQCMRAALDVTRTRALAVDFRRRAVATLQRAAAAHVAIPDATAAVEARIAAVRQAHGERVAALRAIQRCARGMLDRRAIAQAFQERDYASLKIQSMLRRRVARKAVQQQRIERAARVVAAEEAWAAGKIQSMFRRWAAHRGAAAKVLQRIFHTRRWVFAARRATRDAFRDVDEVARRAVMRCERGERTVVIGDENTVRQALLRDARDAGVARGISRVLLMAARNLELDEDAADVINDAEEQARCDVQVHYLAELRDLVRLCKGSRKAAVRATVVKAQRRVLHEEAVMRLRLQRQHRRMLRAAIVEPIHAPIAAWFAGRREHVVLAESLARADIAGAFDEWAVSTLQPQLDRLHCAAQERAAMMASSDAAQQGDDDDDDGALRREDTGIVARSPKAAARDAANGSARRRLIVRLHPVTGKLRAYSKQGALDAGVELTGEDLRGIIAARSRSLDDIGTSTASASRPATDAELAVTASGAQPALDTHAAIHEAATSSTPPRPAGAARGDPPKFLRRVPSLVAARASVPQHVIDACVASEDGVLSLAGHGEHVTDAILPYLMDATRQLPVATTIVLRGSHITDTGVMRLLEHCVSIALPLEELDLGDAPCLSDTAALHVAHRLKRLRHLRRVALAGTAVSTAKRQLISYLMQHRDEQLGQSPARSATSPPPCEEPASAATRVVEGE